MRILLEDTMAIVIDYQEKILPVMDNPEKLLKYSKRLINGLNVLDVPIIVTRQYPNGLGDTVEEIKNITNNSLIFDKTIFSCFGDQKIKKQIETSEKKNIIICGIEAHVCVLQTVIDLLQESYNVVLVYDCIDSRKKRNKKTALKRLVHEGAVVTSYESILFELLKDSRNEKFKEISKIIK